MRICLCAVGRLRAGPERALVDDYTTRFDRIGRSIGLGPIRIVEVEAKGNSDPASEASLLDRAAPKDARRIALDERGRQLTSPEFARLLAGWRDDGGGEAVFLIGGADGLDQTLTGDVDVVLSFGRMVWPHMLVRAMLAEQLYRAASILARTPYHRA